MTLLPACISASTRNCSTNHTSSDTSISNMGTVAWLVARDLYSHLLPSNCVLIFFLKKNQTSCYNNFNNFRPTYKTMPGRHFVTWQKKYKQTTFWFTNIKAWWERKCCKDCSRLHTGQLMLELLWLWDYVCYPVTRLDKIWGLQEFHSSRFSTQLAYEDFKVVSPTHSHVYPQEDIPGTHFFRGMVDPRATLRPERINHWIFPVTPPGFELATFCLETQCLTQIRQSVPHLIGVNEAL